MNQPPKKKYDVVIIASVIPARFPLLLRSLETWIDAAEESGLKVGICLTFEGVEATDTYNFHLLEPFGRRLTVIPGMPVCLEIVAYNDKSGSHIRGYNHWLDQVEGDVYIFTHPEILFPDTTVIQAVAKAENNRYVAFKVFWLSPDMTRDLERFDWQHPETLEREPILFELDLLLKGSVYANANVRSMTTNESTTTFAIDHQTLYRFAPFEDFKDQGADDPFLAAVRQRLGIKNLTLQDPILYHQFHPNTWFTSGELAVERAIEALNRRFPR